MFIKNIISLLAFFALILCNVDAAQASNAIINTSLRKTSTDSVNFTFYTKGESVEKPIVKNKGNNQYVILLPNFTATGSNPDLRTVSDVVNSVDVKTINEGAVTYTKVSVTTSKPVSINAETRRTTQSASDLTGVNNIISKVNLINQDIQASKNIQPQAPIQAQPLPKLTSVQDILNNKDSIGSAVKPAVEVKTVTAPIKSVAAHVPDNTKSIKADAKKLKNENIKNVRIEAVKKIDKVEQNIKSSVQNNVSVNDEEPEVELPSMNIDAEPSVQPIEDVAPVAEKMSVSKVLGSPIALITLLAISIILTVMFIVNRMKLVLADTDDMNSSFIERMNQNIPTRKDFSHIAQSEELNWQEKYNSFKEGKTQEQIEELNSHIGAEPDDDLDIIDEMPEELPEIIEESPNPFASAYQNVHSSEDVIAHSMKRGLKAFADDRTLKMTKRNSGLKNRFKSFETDSVSSLQRNMSELLDTVIKMEEEKPVLAAVTAEQAVESEASYETPVSQQHVSSPIQKAQPTASIKRNKMKIKESRAIDENKGFYLVDMEDKMALMGRINNKFTVLKKFDDKSLKTLQVRRDRDNLYMVRTNGFKALVDVNENKMGVLAEL